ncbi:phage tail domain-containing protein [Tsukamurella spumae]|uniref:Phage tail family protein n=1 Tax=Tsukamurella spumae TaxID=44753 RepID=A0A846X2R7_9ACTN|nr:phage tail domain-containing protein [Tsukamurella spumae]NKY18856.1 hypothetical protein [Tsukamurella spumae]
MIGMKFGEYNLQDPPRIWVSETDIYSSPESQVQAETLARADGAVVVDQRLKPKPYSIQGVIRRESIAELELAIDELKLAMATVNQAMDLDYANGVRRFLSYPTAPIITRKARNTSALFNVQFICPDGVGWSLDRSVLLNPTTIVDSVVTLPLVVEGTYKAEPELTLIVNAIGSGVARTVTISNEATQRGLSVKRNWLPGDVLQTDSLHKTVFVNSVPTEFTGQFPEWKPGAGGLTYLDDFTSRSVTLDGAYTRRWL